MRSPFTSELLAVSATPLSVLPLVSPMIAGVLGVWFNTMENACSRVGSDSPSGSPADARTPNQLVKMGKYVSALILVPGSRSGSSMTGVR